ncbi:type II secretion system secretin GspD [Pseudomonas sp. GOM6]|uniref:type II secretion system secretin GspD n=1 Tax=Pseudomonas sp. GOM6 TaxID=3036944 RepID=UPI002409B56A|nr:type II secretion system secretin GspD [Pseudomonas sp. GOM6]MDG1581831.1 type II secretion system secretin GspD [Pseudomonas sp. GOM6]
MSPFKLKALPLALTLVMSALAAPLPVFAAQPVATANQGAETWTINMKDADIREFIDQVAAITGETFVVDPRVKGQVTVISRSALSLDEVYQLFLSVMSTHGFTVLAQGDQARIVPGTEARSSANSGRAAPDDIETELIQVQHSSVNELIPLLRPMVPQNGHLAAINASNALIISDRRSNIERIRQLIADLDQGGNADYSVINLQHAWVLDAAEALNSSVMRNEKNNGTGTRVIADARTNRLILLGPPAARQRLANLARSLDTPSTRSANARVIRLRHSDAKSLAETLGDISEGLKNTEGGGESTTTKPQNILIRADESLNALVLLADPDTVATLEDIVRNLDVPRAQVMVEAAIVEFSGDISDALGVQWAVDARGGTGGLGGVNFSGTGLSVGTVLQAIQDGAIPENTTLPDGAIIGIGTDSFGALITALSSNSKSNLLSTPSLLTLDNQEAEILVGQNVPFQTGSYTTDAAGSSNPFTTIEREDIGVTLKVTPHINDGATLRLEVEQEISSIAPSAGVNAQAVDLVTNKRSIKSVILADDGQVIVLGGLIQDDVTSTVSKVPLLGDIPLIGGLFRSTKDTHVKRNLMVFLRPTVVRDRAGMASLSGKKYSDISVVGYDDDGQQILIGTDPQRLFDKPGASAIDLRKSE